ncbi:hypothetical protein PMAYCL1PPCAC_25988, partial [Pristionchus mayeri]
MKRLLKKKEFLAGVFGMISLSDDFNGITTVRDEFLHSITNRCFRCIREATVLGRRLDNVQSKHMLDRLKTVVLKLLEIVLISEGHFLHNVEPFGHDQKFLRLCKNSLHLELIGQLQNVRDRRFYNRCEIGINHIEEINEFLK